MKRLCLPLVPAILVGLIAHGTGFRTPDAVLIALACWSFFVIFRRLMTITSTIVVVCLLGALSQVDWYGKAEARYASSNLEASPGTFTHLARTVYHSVEDALGIPHAPFGPQVAPYTPPVQAAAVPEAPVQPAAQSAPATAIQLPGSGAAATLSVAIPVTMRPAPSPPAVNLAGASRVIDAADLYVNGRLVHLAGLSAPAGAVDCWRNGHKADCASMATERLAQLVGASRVSCTGVPDGSAIDAKCSTPLVDDVAKAMLDEGWAVLGRNAGSAYQQVASVARVNRRGLWAANFARADQLEPSFATLRR